MQFRSLSAKEYYFARSKTYAAKLELEERERKLQRSPWLINTKFIHELESARLIFAYRARLEHEWEEKFCEEFAQEGKANFNSAQPRVPAGSSDGGQWTNGGDSIGASRQGFRDYLRGKPRARSFEDIRRTRNGETILVQSRSRGGGIIARFPDATPGQHMRLAVAEANARSATNRAREWDPAWKEPQSFRATIDGEIAHYEAVARAAEVRLLEIRAGINLMSQPQLTEHGNMRIDDRSITQNEIQDATNSARQTGNVAIKTGKYGTPQIHYRGSNGLTVIIETVGRNAGKAITFFRHQN